MHTRSFTALLACLAALLLSAGCSSHNASNLRGDVKFSTPSVNKIESPASDSGAVLEKQADIDAKPSRQAEYKKTKQPEMEAASAKPEAADKEVYFDQDAADNKPSTSASSMEGRSLPGSGSFAAGGKSASGSFGRGRSSASQPVSAPKPATLNPNMYISSTYMGGTGERDRLEKLIQSGVMVDGKKVKLEAFTRTYAQTFPIPTRTALNVVADTERTKIIQEGDRTFLQVGLQAIKGELPRRPPLNIALVIDRSGSMADDRKLENAKAAAMQLVNRLNGSDIFSLVVFDDKADLLVPAQTVHDKERVKRIIARVTPGGGTNIYEGLQTGYREARKHADPESVNRVILLSDGEVTAGISDPQEFQKLTSANVDKDIQTTSVGLGIEFNEDLMMSIAQNGKGNYHFIKAGADTQTVFGTELDELTHIVAKAVKLRIQLAEGVGLVRVLGSTTLNAEQTKQVKNEEKKIDKKVADELGITANRQHEKEEPGIKLLIPDFYRGDNHIVMMEIAVPKGQGTRKIADVFLKYKDLTNHSNQETKTGASIQYTANRAEMIASINRNVKKNLLGFQTGEALTDSANLISQGKVADAVKKVDERMVVLGVAAKEWQDKDLDKDGLLLSRYKTVLTQLNKNPQLAQGDFGQYLSRSLTYAGYKMTR